MKPDLAVAVVSLALLGCGSKEDAAPSTPSDTGVVEDVAVDTAPVDKCSTAKCTGGAVCDPLDGVCKPPKFAKLGQACGGDAGATCSGVSGATCLDGEFLDGYCSITPCSADAPCPLGSSCARVAGKAACFIHCKIDADCRGGTDYKCQDVGSLFVSGGSRRVCTLIAFPCTTNADCPTPLECKDGKSCS